MISETRDFRVDIDQQRGVLRRLEDARARYRLSYLAERPARFATPWGAADLYFGDVVTRIWDGRDWQLETTARSDDTRTTIVSSDGTGTTVDYRAGSQTPGGLRSLSAVLSFVIEPSRILWNVDLTNETGSMLEVGEVAIPLPANMELSSIFEGRPAVARATGEPQRQWHEERVLEHLHIAGHSSYVLLQRPAGDGRILSIVPVGDTAVEAAYQIDPRQANQWSVIFEGPYFLAIHSRAARAVFGWLHNRERQSMGLHGASSVVLAPGETRRYGFELALLDDVSQLRDRLLATGHIYVEAVPAFTVPLRHPVKLALAAHQRPTQVQPEGDSITVHDLGEQAANVYLYSLEFGTVGQKPILVRYGDARWTRVLFYAIPDPSALIEARSQFIVREQVYRNPSDPYGRHLAFMPYADQFQAPFLDSDEAWQVGGSDEYGLPIAMFLAEKNAIMPDAAQVASLESYISDWVLKQLQDPNTLEIRRGVYYSQPSPSRHAAEWTEAEAHSIARFNNYPLLANIYHAMYKVASVWELTRLRTAEEYLELAWKTAVRGFEVGDLKYVGSPAGANLFDLLRDLGASGSEGFAPLAHHLDHFTALVRSDPYPFGSELYIDQTAHAQAYAAAERANDAAAMTHIAKVIQALRAGLQPAWYRFGNDQRGSVCCWYGTTQNSEVLLKAYRRTHGPRLLKLAIGGLNSFLTTVRSDGAARGWFTWWPDRLGFDTRSLDTDLGLYNYLRAAGAYVGTEGVFGLVGYGCRVEVPADGTVQVVPDNGVNNSVYFADHGIWISSNVQLGALTIRGNGRRLDVEIRHGPPLRQPVRLIIQGVDALACSVETAASAHRHALTEGQFAIAVPWDELGESGAMRLEFDVHTEHDEV